MKFVLFSDLHLDTSFTWAQPRAGRKRRQALRETLLRVIQLAIDERADALLCGGDLYEHARFTPDTGEFLRAAFERLDPIPVYLAPGNHDWWGPESLYRRVSWTNNVHVFNEDRLRPVVLADGLTLWGAAHLAPANTDNFLSSFRADREGIHLALFHGSERAWFLAQEGGKQPHAPFDAVDISRAGLNHAFLGHFHVPKHADLFTYPGNPDPLTFGEEGERGAVVATIGSDGGIQRSTRRVGVTEVHDREVDVAGCRSQQDVREAIAEALRNLSGVVRVTLVGELAEEVDLPPQDLNSLAPQMDDLLVHLGELTVAYDFESIAQKPTVQGQFAADVLKSNLPPSDRRRVLVTGLRALDGRDDLEVP